MKSDNNRLEKTLFEISCLMLLTVMIHGAVQSWINNGFTRFHFVDFFIIFVASTFYVISRFYHRYTAFRLPLIFLILISQIFFFFRLSGIYGPSGVSLVSVGIVVIMIAPGKLRVISLTIVCILGMVLVYLQFNTDWVNLDKEVYKSLPFDYIVVTICALMIVNHLKGEFDRERVIVTHQNKKLETLNTSLKASIDEHENTIRKLKSTQAKLIDSEKMASVGRLTAGLAHELNNPLNFIGGNVKPILVDLEELKQGLSQESLKNSEHLFEEIHLLLENITQGSTRATDIITNLLKISPRGGREHIADVNLQHLIAQTCQLLEKAHPNITFDYPSDQPAIIKGNATELNQVILNLLKNAIDALEKASAPFISVSLSQTEQDIILKVCDNGPGVSSENQSKIFEPFFTTKEEGKGTGLGLYISYGIVQKHKGKIRYASHNEGSCFSVHLPIPKNK